MYRRILLGCLIAGAALAELPRSAPYRRDVAAQAHATFGPNAPIATLAAQLHQESTWNASAISGAGALGLAQFMPATAEEMAQKYPAACAPAKPLDPHWAIRCQMRYMKQLLDGVKDAASECDHWAFALSAYNGGAGWVRRDRRKCDTEEGCDRTKWFGNVETINSGRRPSAFKENRDYPNRILVRIAPRYASWGRGVMCDAVSATVSDSRAAPLGAWEYPVDYRIPLATGRSCRIERAIRDRRHSVRGGSFRPSIALVYVRKRAGSSRGEEQRYSLAQQPRPRGYSSQPRSSNGGTA